MQHRLSNRSIPLLVYVTLATVTLPALQAESHCPAGIASVTPRFVQRALIVIPVRVNQKGPFDFMVDTGSQVTVVDPSLAQESRVLNGRERVLLIAQGGYRIDCGRPTRRNICRGKAHPA
jgi:hypothetical protein